MKPEPRKNYGNIGHLPGSKLGEGDHKICDGQARIMLEAARDHKDLIIVQEKLDGANVGILRHEGRLLGLSRKGYLAETSPMEQFQMFQKWIYNNEDRFDFLEEGERVVGEWLAMAHGTRYYLDDKQPFVAFDIMSGDTRLNYINFVKRVGCKLTTAHLLHIGSPISLKKVEKMLSEGCSKDTFGFHGALEPVEGAVYRCEREGKVDFLGKYVRAHHEPGKYFVVNHVDNIWNWRN